MHLDAIGIVSKDIKETLAFYAMFDLKFESQSEEHYEARTSSGLRLMVDSEELIKKINSAWSKALNRQISLCFRLDRSQDVNNLYKNIIDTGYDSIKEPWDAFWGQRYCSVADPDGNQIDIFADL